MRRVTGILFPLLFIGLFVGLTFAAFNGTGDLSTSPQVIELAESGSDIIVIENSRPFFFPGFFLLFFAFLLLGKAFAFRRWARHGGWGHHGHWRQHDHEHSHGSTPRDAGVPRGPVPPRDAD